MEKKLEDYLKTCTTIFVKKNTPVAIVLQAKDGAGMSSIAKEAANVRYFFDQSKDVVLSLNSIRFKVKPKYSAKDIANIYYIIEGLSRKEAEEKIAHYEQTRHLTSSISAS